jgi:hypothetical protein
LPLNSFGSKQIKRVIIKPFAQVFDKIFPLFPASDVEFLARDHLSIGSAAADHNDGRSASADRLDVQVKVIGL